MTQILFNIIFNRLLLTPPARVNGRFWASSFKGR